VRAAMAGEEGEQVDGEGSGLARRAGLELGP